MYQSCGREASGAGGWVEGDLDPGRIPDHVSVGSQRTALEREGFFIIDYDRLTLVGAPAKL